LRNKKQKEKREKKNREETQVSYSNEKKKHENEAQTSQCRSFTQILIRVISDTNEKQKKNRITKKLAF